MLGGRKLLGLFLVSQMGDWGRLQLGPQYPVPNPEFFKPRCQLGK